MNTNARIATLVACAGLVFALPAAAEGQGDESDTLAEKTYWQEQHRKLAEELAWAKHAHETAVLTYAKKKQRRRLRGEPKEEVLSALEETEARLEAAQAAYDRFPEEARRAGALPGWFREAAAQPVHLPQSPAQALR